MSGIYLAKQNGKKILMAGGKPFIMLSGEVHNSNSSSVEYMEQVYDKADDLGLNSLLLPVTWKLLEPEEGKFDFSLVDGLIAQARRREKKLCLLWFGAWKNAQCYYAPEWVKTDLERFQRAQVEKGKNFIRWQDFYGMPYTTLSYLCEETLKADARAFSMLMKHGWYSRTLHEMMPLLAQKYGTEDLQAVCSERREENRMVFGTFGFQVALDSPMIARKDGVCLILKESEDTFYLLLHAAAFGYFSTDKDRPNVDVLSFEEGHFENGTWIRERRLNGDEAVNTVYQGQALLKIKLFAYL